MKTTKSILTLLLCMAFTGTIFAQQSEKVMSTTVLGKGQPIILIHGMACTSDVWDDLVGRYKDNYELHLVHIKGFGNDEFVKKDHYLKAILEELISYTKENNLENAILVGHSMGGFLSLWAAAEAPELFEKVVSVDGVPYFPVLQMPGITPESAKPIVEQMTAGMASMNEEQALQNQKTIVETMIATPSKREKVIEMGISSNPKIIGQAYGEMYTTDIRPLMEKIKIPVQVFGAWSAYQNFGATKENVTLGYQNQLKDIKDADLLVAESAYHFVFLDEPDWFYSEMERFIK
ncbi:alpha/beta fold hydrolase [Belliella marina]|uniref:Alpha/beta fold hydrolase n=1 Tax=Belliella marina TaxID=1644146 RepID=A0ABW4VJI5_9BACT